MNPPEARFVDEPFGGKLKTEGLGKLMLGDFLVKVIFSF
jgi:hypothetical protein